MFGRAAVFGSEASAVEGTCTAGFGGFAVAAGASSVRAGGGALGAATTASSLLAEQPMVVFYEKDTPKRWEMGMFLRVLREFQLNAKNEKDRRREPR